MTPVVRETPDGTFAVIDASSDTPDDVVLVRATREEAEREAARLVEAS